MKLLLIMGLLCVFGSPSFSQDSTVCIAPSTARFFLEAEDERWVLREKDSISNQLILNQGEQLLVKDQIIVTYQNDSSIFADREKAYTTHIEDQREVIDQQSKEIKKQKLTKWGLLILALAGLLL